MSALTRKLILVVDSREDFLQKVVAALKRLPDAPRVVGAGTGEKALQILPLHPIKLIVAAYELNDMIVKELIERARERNADMPFVVYVNPGDRRRHEIATWKDVAAAEYEAECTQIVEQASAVVTQPKEEEKTQVTELPLADAVQHLIRDKATVQLRVVSREGLGVIEMENGEIVHAHTRMAQGEGALKRILSWQNTSLELVHIMKTDSRTVFKKWQEVKDEVDQSRTRSRATGPDSKPTIEKTRPESVKAKREPKPRKEKRREDKPRKERPAAEKRDVKTPKAPKPPRPPGPPRAGRRIRRRWILLIFLTVVLGLAGTGLFIFLREPEIAKAVEEQIRALLQRTSMMIKPPPVPEPTPGPDPATAQLAAEFPEEMQSPPWVVCRALTAWLPVFSESGNTVAASPEMLDQLGLDGEGWAELAGPHGPRFGARILAVSDAVGLKLYLRESMVRALGLDPRYPFHVAVRPFQWPRAGVLEEEVTFNKTRTLPLQYAESWFAAGVSLKTIMDKGLLPGTYVIVKGPGGFQSAKIQLMDRGDAGELWLSKSVRDAVGAESPKDPVSLYPRLAQPSQK